MLSDRLEQDDDFCNACHLTPDRPLHEQIRRAFDAKPAANLAAAHARAGNDARADGAFRCIDCHGGASLVGRARVKALAAKDALAYAVGKFEEPTAMHSPLWDEDCAKCHARFEPAATTGAEPFHAVAVHNASFPVACVACHAAHETGGNANAYFLDAARIRPLCARCHSEFSEGGS
jgi:predicted CXXCH cytochrome family protein